jgi:hypothetical protein
MDTKLVDVNGSFTLHASDNTDYRLIFKNGMICLENELGHCVCEFFADDMPSMDKVCENCTHCYQLIVDEYGRWEVVDAGGTHCLCRRNEETFDVDINGFCSYFERKEER